MHCQERMRCLASGYIFEVLVAMLSVDGNGVLVARDAPDSSLSTFLPSLLFSIAALPAAAFASCPNTLFEEGGPSHCAIEAVTASSSVSRTFGMRDAPSRSFAAACGGADVIAAERLGIGDRA